MSFISATNVNRVHDQLQHFLTDKWDYYDMLQYDMIEWYKGSPSAKDIGKIGNLKGMNDEFIRYYTSVIYPSRTPGPPQSSWPQETGPMHGSQSPFRTNLAKYPTNPAHTIARPIPGYLSALDQLKDLTLGGIPVMEYCSEPDIKYFGTRMTRGRNSRNTGVERRVKKLKPQADGCSCVSLDGNCRGKCGCKCDSCSEFIIENKKPRRRYDATSLNLKDGSTYTELNNYAEDGMYINSNGQRFIPQVDRDGYVGMRNVNDNALGWEYGVKIDRGYPTIVRDHSDCRIKAPDYKYPKIKPIETRTRETPNAPFPLYDRTLRQVQKKYISNPELYPGFMAPIVQQREKTNLFEHGKYKQQLLERFTRPKYHC